MRMHTRNERRRVPAGATTDATSTAQADAASGAATDATSATRVLARRIALLVVVVLVLAWSSAARAAPVTVGVFAPSAPFPSTAARVELASRLATAFAPALDGATVGRVYARAADFAAAVRSGEVAIALVDPAYLASIGGGGEVIAVALHAGDAERRWQLVARTGTPLAALAGQPMRVPSLGGREPELVRNVLLGGELARGFFARLEAAPDTASALAALALGKTDAAIVPATGELPPGTAVVLALPALPGPVLVIYGAARRRDAVVAAALAFAGDATVAGFRTADGAIVRELARRFTVAAKQPPFSGLTTRHLLDDLLALLGGRAFAIERTPAAAFATAPSPR